MTDNIKRLKCACYITNVTMAVTSQLSPLLFLTFHSRYGISYSMLGALVLINFVTQLAVDLVFSFFSHKFNISKTVKLMPLLTVTGLFVYAAFPFLFPEYVYMGLALGTLIFSASAGLAEVLISPIIASLPSKDPDREMSRLHSAYAWGTVAVVCFCTLFLLVFKNNNWQLLPIVLSSVPLFAFFLFYKANLPEMEMPEKSSGAVAYLKNKELWLCVCAIFLGGAAECTMAQWASGYLEQALGIKKLWGDIFGVALFGAAQGLGRTLYAKFGKNLTRSLLLGAAGAFACYMTASLSNSSLIGLFACALTGFCVSVLWPGCLTVASERFPKAGVFIFAMMAAGGDLGASVGPQLIGVITDMSQQSSFMLDLSLNLGISAEQLGLKAGMLVGSLFPLLAVPVYLYLGKIRKSKS